ncbi:DUF5667 domain-containing protein [Nonomuraea dietziae]|uniref:DUF5667 domain-containing protein n=1 Tax=Nonomuraea dietziae TaxID=65515 RepID=A0A7W5YQ44_9ACTN|nr:DUF5667 domain-containing protein [Nonomuraea dietziae]MBB3729187.1 hypothetical protein [Nonomuraea dietziae]
MGRSRQRRHDDLLRQLTDLGDNLPLGPGPDPAFRARLRETLMAESFAAPVPERRGQRRRQGRWQRQWQGRWLAPALSAGMALVMVLSVMVTSRAVPGDMLYPLKRAAEGAISELNPDKAGGELEAAAQRAEELRALLDAGGGGPHVGATLQEMEASTRSAMERLDRAAPRDQEKINQFVEEQHKAVDPMLERLNDVDQEQASGYLDYIDGLRLPPG